jgi:hypothetical protein
MSLHFHQYPQECICKRQMYIYNMNQTVQLHVNYLLKLHVWLTSALSKPLPAEHVRKCLLGRKISIDTRENTTTTASFHVANADCCTDERITCIAIWRRNIRVEPVYKTNPWISTTINWLFLAKVCCQYTQECICKRQMYVSSVRRLGAEWDCFASSRLS